MKRIEQRAKPMRASHLLVSLLVSATVVGVGPAAAGRPANTPTPGAAGEMGPVEGSGKWQVHPRAAQRQQREFLFRVHEPNASRHGQPHPPGPSRQLRQARPLPDGPEESKKWHATLTRHADKSVTGSIRVEAASHELIRQGRVQARADKGRLWGEIFDDDGNQAATFEAGLGANGVEVNFTTRDDETGTFTWDGVLPAPRP